MSDKLSDDDIKKYINETMTEVFIRDHEDSILHAMLKDWDRINKG